MAKPNSFLACCRALVVALLATSLSASADIPVKWTTDTFKVKPLVYECYHGETLDLESSLTSYGEPLALSGETARLYWQTNGMGSAWWTTNAAVRVDADTGATNILAATFSGAFDTGAKSVTGFIGIEGKNYRAAFQLNFRDSPGFAPNALPIPPQKIDWANVANANVDAAPFVVKGGAGGMTPTQVTNISTFVASSATVTNAGAVAVAESIGSAAYDEAVAAAKTYTDNSTNGLIRASYNVSPQATDLFGWKFVPPTDSQSSPYPATIFVKYGSGFSEAIRFGGPGTTCSLVGTWNIQNGWDYLTTEYGMQTLPSYLSSLAWHPTSATLSGYGITDAYTKEEVNAISNGAVASAVSKIRKDVITDGTNTVNASLKFIKTAQPVAGVGTWKSTDSERGVETVNWVEILDGWVPASHSIGIFRAGTRWNVAGVGISIYYNTLPPVIELDFVRDGVHVHEKLEYQVFTETMLATTNTIPSKPTIETYAIDAVANSDNLWNASNAKLTTRITQVSTPIAEGVFETNADYALTNLTGAAITLSSGCIGNVTMAANTSVILDFSAAENRSGDCLLYAINATATDYTISPQPTAQYAFVSADLAKALTIGKATTNILSFTRLKADTVLVSKLEVK